MTKQEILDKYVRCECWPAKDGGKVYNSSCPQHGPDPESAMDEWAEGQAISFAEWLYIWDWEKVSVDSKKWLSPSNIQFGRKTIGELYQLFLQQQTSIK